MLIVVMAFLLVAAYVLILNSGELQQSSFSTSDIARRQVTTGVDVVDLPATNGRDGDIEDFKYLVKLNPRGEPVSLKDSVIYVNTHNETLRLTYKGACRRNSEDGYYTVK